VKALTFSEALIAVILVAYNKKTAYVFPFRTIVVFLRFLSKLLHDLA